MTMKDVVYFELNNWFAGRDYPDAEPFLTWCGDDMNLYFNNENFVKENKLCVVQQIIDMSCNWCITAPKKFVLENCPKLLSDETYESKFIVSSSEGEKYVIEKYSYKDFIRIPDEDGDVYGRFDGKFLPWAEENIGIHYAYEDE